MRIESDAEIVGNYRYWLSRIWDRGRGRLPWLMLNPSDADGTKDDPTIRVCMGRAQRLGYGGIVVYNLFAWRATNPRELALVADPIGPENDEYLRQLMVADYIACGWGDGGLLRGRAPAVVKMLRDEMGLDLRCLGVTKKGQPKHPLRISYGTPLIALPDAAIDAARGRQG